MKLCVEWCDQNPFWGVSLQAFVYFEFDAPENLQDEYYSKNFDCINVLKKWNPECSIKPSFLLSIHESEEGPIAIFAIERKERLYIDIIENF